MASAPSCGELESSPISQAPGPPDRHTGRRGVTLPRSVAAGRDSPPVVDGVRDGLGPRRAVAERQQAITDFAADAVLLDMIPIPERVLVFDLGSLLAGERDRPVGRVDAGEGNGARVPLGVAAIQPIEEAGDVDATSR